MNIEAALGIECLLTLVRARENGHEIEESQASIEKEIAHIQPAVRLDSIESANFKSLCQSEKRELAVLRRVRVVSSCSSLTPQR